MPMQAFTKDSMTQIIDKTMQIGKPEIALP